jgi:hypothetical protein
VLARLAGLDADLRGLVQRVGTSQRPFHRCEVRPRLRTGTACRASTAGARAGSRRARVDRMRLWRHFILTCDWSSYPASVRRYLQHAVALPITNRDASLSVPTGSKCIDQARQRVAPETQPLVVPGDEAPQPANERHQCANRASSDFSKMSSIRVVTSGSLRPRLDETPPDIRAPSARSGRLIENRSSAASSGPHSRASRFGGGGSRERKSSARLRKEALSGAFCGNAVPSRWGFP